MESIADKSDSYKIQLPADLDYIPPLRQFVSELARGEGFPKKFCFRSEIIIDELCTNAIIHGPKGMGGYISFIAGFKKDTLELCVHNQAGSPQDLKKLKKAIEVKKEQTDKEKCRGIALVKILSNEVNVELNKQGITEVKVVKMNDVSKYETADDK